jgi:hypothetical protein
MEVNTHTHTHHLTIRGVDLDFAKRGVRPQRAITQREWGFLW